MVTINKFTYDVRCLSTDTKPTEGIPNGSVCTEIDTGGKYMFDEAGKIWRYHGTDALQRAAGEEY